MFTFGSQLNNPQQSSGDYDLQAIKQRIAEGTIEIKKELLAKWQEQYAGTPLFPAVLSKADPVALDLLLAFKNTLLYNEIAEKFTLTAEQRSYLPKIVWGICLNKTWAQLKISIITHLNVNENIAEQISAVLNQNIIEAVKKQSEQEQSADEPVLQKATIAESQPEKTLVALNPEEAYRQFPEIGEQLITTEPIMLQSTKSPARPSIKNWLADYTFKLGFKLHSSIERGTYLFQDENAKNLSFQDKQKLSYVLKAYDEKTPLTIDTSAKKVIFPATQLTRREEPAEKKEAVSFSFGQKLPYEKIQQPQEAGPAEQFKNIISLQKKEIPASPADKNVVNLKELS